MKLPRPSIPGEVKLRVLLKQLGEAWPDDVVASAKAQRILADTVTAFKAQFADLLTCEIADLRLDHDPALENRTKIVRTSGGKIIKCMLVPAEAEVIGYEPDANDPQYLFYRTSHSHHIKTNVRGDGAQFADNVLAKRERRRRKKLDGKRWSKKIAAKRNPWPPKGSRPFGGKLK